MRPRVKYGLLSQKNPAYAEKRWEELGDLYVGGYDLLEKASRYMPRFVGETPERYNERLSAASYLNYIGAIADSFVANLFEQELTITQAADATDKSTPGEAPEPDGVYAEFAHDADLRGTTFVKLMRQVFTTALVKGKAILAVDFPTAAKRPESLAEEEKLGTSRAYAFDVPIEQLVDWEYGEDGRFEWAILHRTIAAACVTHGDAWQCDRGVQGVDARGRASEVGALSDAGAQAERADQGRRGDQGHGRRDDELPVYPAPRAHDAGGSLGG